MFKLRVHVPFCTTERVKLTGSNKCREGHLHVVLNLLMLDNIRAEWDGPSQSCHSHWLVPHITCSTSLSLRKTKKTISNLRLWASTLGTEKNGKYIQEPVKPKIGLSDQPFSQWGNCCTRMHHSNHALCKTCSLCLWVICLKSDSINSGSLELLLVSEYTNKVSSDLYTISGHFLLDAWKVHCMEQYPLTVFTFTHVMDATFQLVQSKFKC